jgi:hypothetical protein
MAQISKGDTFIDGEQVTGARLNQLVDSSSILIGAITEQVHITANTLEATDSTLVNDAGVLKEANISDILNSNIPITTSSINGVAGSDIAVNPAAGQKFDVNGAFESTTSNTTGNATVGGNATVSGNLALTGQINGTGAVRLASGTTGERPATPPAGSFRFNTTTNTLEVYTGTDWATTAAVYNGLPVYGVFEFVSNGFGYVASGTLGGHTGSKYQTLTTLSKTNKEYWEISFSVSALLADLNRYAASGTQKYYMKLIGSNGVTYATKTFEWMFETYTVFEGGGPEGGGSNVTYDNDDYNRSPSLSVILDTSVVFSGVTLAIVVTTINSPTVSRVNPSPSTSNYSTSGGVYVYQAYPLTSYYSLTNNVNGKKWVAP